MGTRMLSLKRQDSRLTHHNTPSRPAIYTKKGDFFKLFHFKPFIILHKGVTEVHSRYSTSVHRPCDASKLSVCPPFTTDVIKTNQMCEVESGEGVYRPQRGAGETGYSWG